MLLVTGAPRYKRFLLLLNTTTDIMSRRQRYGAHKGARSSWFVLQMQDSVMEMVSYENLIRLNKMRPAGHTQERNC